MLAFARKSALSSWSNAIWSVALEFTVFAVALLDEAAQPKDGLTYAAIPFRLANGFIDFVPGA